LAASSRSNSSAATGSPASGCGQAQVTPGVGVEDGAIEEVVGGPQGVEQRLAARAEEGVVEAVDERAGPARAAARAASRRAAEVASAGLSTRGPAAGNGNY
jgi:hypothetical protein